MNFRELTNAERQNTEWQPTESARTALELRVLQTLNEDIARYLQSGGRVKWRPSCKFSHVENFAQQNRERSEKHAQRNGRRRVAS